MSQLVARLDIDSGKTRAAAAVFARRFRIISELDQHTSVDSLQTEIAKYNYRGGRTDIDNALEEIRTDVLLESAGDRPDVPNVVVMFIGGSDNDILDVQASVR